MATRKLATRIKAQGALVSATADIGAPVVEVVGWTFDQQQGQTYDLAARGFVGPPGSSFVLPADLYTLPAGRTAVWGVVSPVDGTTITPQTQTGEAVIVTFDEAASLGQYEFTVDLEDSAARFEPVITNEPQIEQYLTDDSGGIDGAGGPTWSAFIAHLGILWKSYRDNGTESIGDYIGLAPDGVTETPMSGNPFQTVSITGTLSTYYPFTADVTRIIADYVASGQNKGLYLVASGSGITLKGRLSDAPPTLTVRNTLGQEFTCPVRCTARWTARSESETPKDGRTFVPLSASRRGYFNFDLSAVTGTVELATMNFSATRTATATLSLRIFKADPPTFTLGIGNAQPVLGLAAEVAAANPGVQERTALYAHPDVLYAGDFTGTVLNLATPGEGRAPAHLFNGGTIDTISQAAVDRAITDGAPGAVAGPAVEILDDPDAPGTRMWRGQFPITLPSWSGAAGGTWKSAFDPFFSWTGTEVDPLGGRMPTGGHEEIYCRAYFYLEPEWLELNETAKIGLVFDTRFGHWIGTGWDPDGGNGGIFSDGRKRPDHYTRSTTWSYQGDEVSITGQDIRSNFKATPTNDPAYPYAGLKRIQSYAYNIDNPDRPSGFADQDVYWNPDAYDGTNPVNTLFPAGINSPGYPVPTTYGNVRFGSYPNLIASTPPFASVWQPGRWYCFEQRVRLNSVVEPFDRYGNGVALFDGLIETWINGVQVESLLGWRWRRHPAITIRRAGPLLYNGGSSTYCATQQWFRINHCVAATRYIGPRVRP